MMDRLTEERGERTYKLFHIGWYINLACAIAAILGALLFLKQVLSGASENAPDGRVIDMMLMVGFMIVAAILLMGAGISRYQSRLEGQNLEIKLAVNKVADALDSMKQNAE